MPEPKSFFTKTGLSFTKDKRLLVLAGAGLGILILLLLSNQHSRTHKIKPVPSKDENALYTKAQIDNFIKEQLSKKELDPKEKTQHVQNKPPEARKIKTAIAVFVKKKEEEKLASHEINRKNEAFGVPTGSKIKAHLANAIFSFNVTSPAVAVVDEDFMKGEEVIIPKGTQFIGDAAVLKSQDRINVRFLTMVLPDGKEKRVSAMALSLDGSGGIKGKVDKQTDKSIFKALGETVLAGSAVVLGTHDRALSLQDEFRLNTARNLSDDARGALNNVKVEESITVEAYTPVLVLFLESI